MTTLEKILAQYGDAWVWCAFYPVNKLLPVFVVGKRTMKNAKKLVTKLDEVTEGEYSADEEMQEIKTEEIILEKDQEDLEMVEAEIELTSIPIADPTDHNDDDDDNIFAEGKYISGVDPFGNDEGEAYDEDPFA